MSLITLMALGLPFTPIINWAAFAVCFFAARRKRGIRALIHMRWVSFGIALMSTGLAVLAVAFFDWPFPFSVGPEMFAALIALPMYLLSAINVVFLVMTVRGSW